MTGPADLQAAAQCSSAPISGFAVGAVAVGASGAVYPGANLEFAGLALSASVHAEQSAVMNAWLHGEEGLVSLTVTAAPCGYCRQFLWELAGAGLLRVHVGADPPVTLDTLLPRAFGPAELGVAGRLMAPGRQALVLDGPADPLAETACREAEQSYAPYSGALAGVALLGGGAVVAGRCAENAAFNPSLSPLQVAAALWRLAGSLPIERAVLVAVPGPVDHAGVGQAILASIAPGIPLEVREASLRP